MVTWKSLKANEPTILRSCRCYSAWWWSTQAPITAAIVIAGGLQHHDTLSGFEQGIHRVAEVLLGCVVGIAVAWALSKIWPLPEPGRVSTPE